MASKLILSLLICVVAFSNVYGYKLSTIRIENMTGRIIDITCQFGNQVITRTNWPDKGMTIFSNQDTSGSTTYTCTVTMGSTQGVFTASAGASCVNDNVMGLYKIFPDGFYKNGVKFGTFN
ncbi:hypothetical protein CHUAL_008396 [Chamberlinius hualienensis]